jgi:hypothetical protein
MAQETKEEALHGILKSWLLKNSHHCAILKLSEILLQWVSSEKIE